MKIRSRVAAGLLIAAGVPLTTIPAWASHGSSNGDNVTLCHRNDSNNNPYVQITISPDAVFRQGHDGHDGPVWNPTLKSNGEKWGDIIPPFDYTVRNGKETTTGHYDGKNWTTEGQTIWNSGCATQGEPAPSASSVSPSESSSSASPSESSSSSMSASPSGSPSESGMLPSPSQSSSSSPSETPTTGSPTPSVLPTHATRPPSEPPVGPATPLARRGHELPFTGSPTWLLVGLGVILIVTGVVLLRKRA